MNMCADSENNALFNSGPLNKPVYYVCGTILLFYVIIVNKSILNHCMQLTVIIDNKIFVFDIGIIGFLYT